MAREQHDATAKTRRRTQHESGEVRGNTDMRNPLQSFRVCLWCDSSERRKKNEKGLLST